MSKKHSKELPALCNQSHRQIWSEERKWKQQKPVPLEWRDHHDSISYWHIRTANGSTGPCLQLCLPPSAKSPGKLCEPKNWQSLKEWEEGCPPSRCSGWCFSVENSEVENTHLCHMGLIKDYWIPAQALSALPPLGALGPGWSVHPWPGLVPMDKGSLRAQCSEALSQAGPVYALGQQQGRGLGYTYSPLHLLCPMGPPCLTWLFSFGKWESLLMLSLTRWCRIWYCQNQPWQSLLGHNSLLALQDIRHITLMHHPAGENTPK